ncbi:MAG: tRNA (guanosine(46)-N7)-methyltransferase TrmB [Firmicutes bacterium]|nr:tRNA (guanosine(46)-N7)-methyltransferase TrmB [Bacillota bacterium]
MRLRYVPIAKELIESHPEFVLDHQPGKTFDFNEKFHNDAPIHIEIGMGKGKFIYSMAKKNPHINYIGIEKFDSVIVRALEKLIAEPLPNLILLRADAKYLCEIFKAKSISKIYLNFSDPWPKDRHAKRRLTHQKFLKDYQILLTNHSVVEFKTDNVILFDFSVEEMQNYPMDITYLSRDLHQEDIENVMTEFEEKFSNKGNKIYKLTATFMEEK